MHRKRRRRESQAVHNWWKKGALLVKRAQMKRVVKRIGGKGIGIPRNYEVEREKDIKILVSHSFLKITILTMLIRTNGAGGNQPVIVFFLILFS